jgi:hypothetical protein
LQKQELGGQVTLPCAFVVITMLRATCVAHPWLCAVVSWVGSWFHRACCWPVCLHSDVSCRLTATCYGTSNSCLCSCLRVCLRLCRTWQVLCVLNYC